MGLQIRKILFPLRQLHFRRYEVGTERVAPENFAYDMKKTVSAFILLALLLPSFGAQADDLFGGKAKKRKPKVESAEKDKKDSLSKKKGVIKPYDEVITRQARSMDGFFRVHYVEGKYFFEIADSLLGRDILVVNRIVKAPVDLQKRKVGYPGDHIGERVIRFEEGNDKNLFVREVSYLEHARDTAGLYQAVRNSNIQPIVATFPLQAVRQEGAVKHFVIDMTDYIRKDHEMFSFDDNRKDGIGAGSMIGDASYIDTLKAFPRNIEVRTVRTFKRSKSMDSELSRFLAQLFASSNTPLTYELNSSMLLLPKEPMKSRIHDERVGYFAVGYKDFDRNPQEVEYSSRITRWRLEPKEEDVERYLKGELVEPRKPIVIYIDPATPKKWVPYLIQGVNDWQVAFEQAGFKNAIMAREAPADDPTWSLEDARHSAIVYKPSDIPNASGPHVHDPRSGEILETHINWYHNVMRLLHDWYVIQAGAVDPAARKPRFDDELMGQLIRFVSSHEVGHTLGLRHNFGSSHTVPVEKLRDKEWVEANGHTPSIMDYARFNYVAQPEDSISREGIFPRVGMYDKWAIEWGYRWFPQYKTAEEEQPHLNQWIIEKLRADKRYSFGTELDRNDPRNQSEDLGDDAMLAGTYGIKNLKRIMPNILDWTYEPNEGYTKAVYLYQSLLGQFTLYMGHVATNVGGIYSNPISVEQTEVKAMEYVPKEIQQRAVAFLNRELFDMPAWLRDTGLEERTGINTYSAVTRIQTKVLKRLLSSRTFDKMTNNERVNGAGAYTVQDLFGDLHKTIWSDITSGQRPTDSRRNLQKTYVNALISMLDTPHDSSDSAGGPGGYGLLPFSTSSEAPVIARGQLTELRRALTRMSASSTGIVKSHYQNLLYLIDSAFSTH